MNLNDLSIDLAKILAMRYAYNINWAADFLFNQRTNPGLSKKDYILEKIRENGNPYTPPQGMPDVNSKGEYPETQEPSDAPYKPPEGMPDYTPDPNKPASEDNSYTKNPANLKLIAYSLKFLFITEIKE